jgi:hypothetical protein
MNPGGVRVVGSTLHVDGWFCSRQFSTFLQTDSADLAREAGFKRIECSSAAAYYWQDLCAPSPTTERRAAGLGVNAQYT